MSDESKTYGTHNTWVSDYSCPVDRYKIGTSISNSILYFTKSINTLSVLYVSNSLHLEQSTLPPCKFLCFYFTSLARVVCSGHCFCYIHTWQIVWIWNIVSAFKLKPLLLSCVFLPKSSSKPIRKIMKRKDGCFECERFKWERPPDRTN